MISNVIAALVILILVGGALTYIVRAKKRGTKCIGCPDSGGCSAKHAENSSGCGCGCHGEKQ